MKSNKIFLLALMAISLLALAVSCGDDSSDNGEVKGDISDLYEGALAEVEVQVLGDGTLYALEIELGDYEEDEDDEDEDEDDDFEEEFIAPVEAIADDFSYIIVYGDLMVMLDLDDDDDDDDDEDEDEGELEISDLDVGMWVAVEGLYSDTDGIFHADEILAAGEEEREIGSKIQNLTESSFTMIGLTITYDEDTEVEIEEGEDDDEDEDDEEDDD